MGKISYKRGLIAEELVQEYYEGLGYSVIEKRYRARPYEIDLILKSPNGEIVFVEVKALSNTNYGFPQSRVTKRKQNNLFLAAQCFLSEQQTHFQRYRFDVVTVNFSGQSPQISHFPNAFQAEDIV